MKSIIITLCSRFSCDNLCRCHNILGSPDRHVSFCFSQKEITCMAQGISTKCSLQEVVFQCRVCIFTRQHDCQPVDTGFRMEYEKFCCPR